MQNISNSIMYVIYYSPKRVNKNKQTKELTVYGKFKESSIEFLIPMIEPSCMYTRGRRLEREENTSDLG